MPWQSQIVIHRRRWQDKNKFDNSDYPKNSKFYEKTNKEIIGKFKDEAASFVIKEFVWIRSKMHSYIKDNNKNSRTAKKIWLRSISNKEITKTCLVVNKCITRWKKSESNIINLGAMNGIQFYCHGSTITDIFWMMKLHMGITAPFLIKFIPFERSILNCVKYYA